MSSYPPLPCDQITYRAIAYDVWIDKKTRLPKWQTFKRRTRDHAGISLGLTTARCTRDLSIHYGIVTVHVGYVRAISTEEDPIDAIQNEPEHANIEGLPYLYNEDGTPIQDIQLKAKAQNLAEQVLEHVLVHMRKHSLSL
jgi:hypothetical protein